MARRTDLKILYGVANFKTIRSGDLCYIDKIAYLMLTLDFAKVGGMGGETLPDKLKSKFQHYALT